MLVVRPESGLFYANADGVRREILGLVDSNTRGVVLDAQSIPAIDVTAADMLGQLTTELSDRQVQLLVARDIGQVRDMLAQSDATTLGAMIYPSVSKAVASVQESAGKPLPRSDVAPF